MNPLTWADVDDITADMSGGIAPSPLGFEFNGAVEVHNVGEVWPLSLWEVRSCIIAAMGGDVAAGNEAMLQHRDRRPQDDADRPELHRGARRARRRRLRREWLCPRGVDLGGSPTAVWGSVEASLAIATHVGVKESFLLPHPAPGAVVADDSAGDGNGFIDPGETIDLSVPLFNPWRSASKDLASATATLTSTTPGVTVTSATASYGPIPAQATVAGNPFTFEVDLSVGCGSLLRFELLITSAKGVVTVPLRAAGSASRWAPARP